MKKITAVIVLVASSFYGFAQKVDKLIKQDDVERIIKTLSADDMQGRATFTHGIEKAARFIESEFKAIGLKPMQGDTGYRQNFYMIKSTPGNMDVSINGSPVAKDNVAAFADVSFNWNNTGATVSAITADMDFAKSYRQAFNNHTTQFVIVDPKFEAAFKRLQKASLRGQSSFKASPYPPVVFVLGSFGDIRSYTAVGDIISKKLPLFNIAGIIPGKKRPDEYVVFSGHYDHLGILTGNRVMQGDSIANGADDDASGTTAVITLAKYFKKRHNNARTLVFVAFTAEEIGEYGSQYFATTVNPDKVVAMFNIEMIGKASKWGQNAALITGFERSDFGTILQKNLQGTAFHFYPDPYTDQNLFYRSDNASLAKLGVPAHTISTDQIDKDTYYHTVKDEYSTLDAANITATIKAVALSARTIISGKDTPSRVAKLER